ncbi:unnamed protein product [Ectocarpus fasciculatus]
MGLVNKGDGNVVDAPCPGGANIDRASAMEYNRSGPPTKACLRAAVAVAVGLMYEALREASMPTKSRNSVSAASPRFNIAAPFGSCHSMRNGFKTAFARYVFSCRIAATPFWSNALGISTSTTLSYKAVSSTGVTKDQKNACSVMNGRSGSARAARKTDTTRAAPEDHPSPGFNVIADKAACANSAAPPVKACSLTYNRNQSVAVTCS